MEPLRVVVIDDEVNTCTFLRTVFEAEGHVCHAFVRAEEGEQFLASNPADLVMVDVYLGSLNGIDLLQELKAQQPGVYPVIMTANVSVETAARALSEGAVDYVSKPLTVEQRLLYKQAITRIRKLVRGLAKHVAKEHRAA